MVIGRDRDDIVVCSLHPSNDYKTSVLSGLSPSTILEICNRAISFWQYQIHQEATFQQAVVRNLNDKNAQLQKQLDNVVREANNELTLLNHKKEELERDLELERRKVRELQDASKDRDREYAKLKVQLDKIKRKALFGGPTAGNEGGGNTPNQFLDDQRPKPRPINVNQVANNNVNINAVVGGMEANGIQRTPLVPRTQGRSFIPNQPQVAGEWVQPRPQNPDHSRTASHRQPFSNFNGERSYVTGNTSDRSSSANEVEQMLNMQQHSRASISTSGGWQFTNAQPVHNARAAQKVFAPAMNQRVVPRGFRPAIIR